jgi:hypothetical protein
MIIKKITLLIFSILLISCDSKLMTTEDAEIVNAAKSIEDPDSSAILIENTNEASQVTCTPTNSAKVLITQNQKSIALCRDMTSLDPSYSLGPICPGGVSIANFSTKSDWVPCESVTICGKKAHTTTEVKSTNTAQVRQLQFSNLSWGCKGEIEVKLNDGSQAKNIVVDVKPPTCPKCDITGLRTCDACGTDTTAPEILDVFTESTICRKIRILVFARDENSGINGYSFDGGITWQSESEKEVTGITLTLDTQKIWVRDRSGNISKYSKALSARSTACDCNHAGTVVQHGQAKTVFESSDVACGSTCKSGNVTCDSGVLSGNTNYKNLGCSPKVCKCTTPWGEKIDLNASIDAYKKSSISCSETANCSDANNKITVKCTDVIANTLQVTAGSGPVTNYPHSSCSKDTCGCTHLGMVLKPTDPPLKVYKLEQAVAPATCALSGNQGVVSCIVSGTSFRMTGDINTTIYKYTTCKDMPVPGSGTGIGESPLNVGVGTGGGAGGGIGNSEGDGEGFKKRFKPGGGGSGCDINKPPYYCWGASGGLSTENSFCLLPGDDGYSNSETNNTDFRQRISMGGAIAAYSRKEVACGDSCSKYMGVVSCDHGVMSDKTKYRFLNCREVCP